MNEFIRLLQIEAEELHSGFNKASIEGKGTPQDIADRREQLFCSFIKKYFPFPYVVTKGQIEDSHGRRSNSIDCVVLSPSHPNTIDVRTGKASFIMADGVDYAIEIKGKINDRDELRRGLKQLRSVKQLTRARDINDMLIFPSRYSNEYKEWIRKVPAIMFANESYSDPESLATEITDYYESENVPSIEQFDLIAVNQRYVLIKGGKYSPYKSLPEGLFWAETNENTVAQFLLRLNVIPQSVPEATTSIIPLYLKSLPGANAQFSQKINDRIAKITL